MGIKVLTISDMPNALAIAHHAFEKFIAPDYTEEGKDEFYKFASIENFAGNMQSDNYYVWGACIEDQIAGVAALRNENCVAIFSVHESYHLRGIGKRLMHTLKSYAKENYSREFITVNASNYAVPVYEKLGFVRVSETQNINGVVSNPRLFQ